MIEVVQCNDLLRPEQYMFGAFFINSGIFLNETISIEQLESFTARI